MTKANKVLFITQEITPYVSESEMSLVGRNLPQAIQEKGREIRTFMPKWGNINERRNQLHEVIRLSGMNLIIDDTDHPLIIKVASIQSARMQVYFIDNDDYFQNRLQVTDENGEEYEDNDARAIFYALVGRNLPQAIQEKGREIRTFMPKWGNINERRNQLHEVIRLSGMNLIIDDTDHPLIIKVASIQSARMQVYFIDNDDYFQNRLQVTDENGEEYEDNDARAIFYARGVLETVKKLRWCPDIIHCHGWMTALAPLYIKKVYKDEPSFRDAKVIFSLYEDDFKQPFHADFSNKLLLKGIAKKDIAGLKEPIDYTALCKLAADFSDGIIQQSEHVNEEVLNYARESGKPVLEYQSPENFAEACNDFYDKVWETEQK